jgi:hypothetical protein
MSRRSIEDWQVLITEQEKSGLTVPVFCRERGLNTKYFYLRRKRLSTHSAFVPVQLKAASTQGIRIDWNDLSLQLPISLSPQWVADLIKHLRA